MNHSAVHSTNMKAVWGEKRVLEMLLKRSLDIVACVASDKSSLE